MAETQHDPAASPIAVSLAVVVGNGFTLDYTSQLGLPLDISRPVDWPLQIPAQPQLDVRDAMPNFFKAFEQLRLSKPDVSQFDLLREILGVVDMRGSAPEVEARHFLTHAYRWFTTEFTLGPLEQWQWLHWCRAHSHLLATTVSFNYDCLLEEVLRRTGRQYNRVHNVAAGIVRVFKPHGSADFDLRGLARDLLSYPLRVYGHMNNFPLRIVPREQWSHPPSEPLIVLPYEANPYSQYQWVAPGYSIGSSRD